MYVFRFVVVEIRFLHSIQIRYKMLSCFFLRLFRVWRELQAIILEGETRIGKRRALEAGQIGKVKNIWKDVVLIELYNEWKLN